MHAQLATNCRLDSLNNQKVEDIIRCYSFLYGMVNSVWNNKIFLITYVVNALVSPYVMLRFELDFWIIVHNYFWYLLSCKMLLIEWDVCTSSAAIWKRIMVTYKIVNALQASHLSNNISHSKKDPKITT